MTALAPLEFSSVRRLTNLNDINRALHETVARERSIEAELEMFLSKRGDIEKMFSNLHDAAAEVILRRQPTVPFASQVNFQTHLSLRALQ